MLQPDTLVTALLERSQFCEATDAAHVTLKRFARRHTFKATDSYGQLVQMAIGYRGRRAKLINMNTLRQCNT